MATCGHHYPVEGCHNCFEWIEKDLDDTRKQLDEAERMVHELFISCHLERGYRAEVLRRCPYLLLIDPAIQEEE